MKRNQVDADHVRELLLQALETERGGIKVYTAAIAAAVNEDLHEEWQKYLRETKKHERILTQLLTSLELDPEAESPGRAIVAHHGAALVAAIELALKNGDPEAAQLVAAECVVLAETKDHLNWELIGMVAEKGPAATAKLLKAAHEEVEPDEDHHLYHTTGWARELWIAALGLPAVLPPPEEVRDVETAIGAARAQHAREKML
jgi:hypothetical protein